MVNSLADASIKQYNTTFKLWWEFCKVRGISPYIGRISEIITFFQNLLESTTNRYGSFNSHRAALALIMTNDLRTDTYLKRFLKGVFRMRPPQPRYNTTWDPQQVLSYLQTAPDNNLKQLSCKLVTLLTLATGQRIQTISLIKSNNIITTDDGVKIFIPDIVKTSGPRRMQPSLDLPYLTANPKLCVASLITKYLTATKKLRHPDGDCLFLTHKKPHGPASKQSLSRWVKETLGAAGVNVSLFTAHSTRHAATSAAFRKGLSMDVIRKSAGWTEASSVFATFYNRPLTEKNTLLTTVLGSE